MTGKIKFLDLTESDIEILNTVKSLLEQNYFRPDKQQLMLAVSLIKSSNIWKNNNMRKYWMTNYVIDNDQILINFKRYSWNVSEFFKPSRLERSYVVARAVRFITKALDNQYFIYESKN